MSDQDLLDAGMQAVLDALTSDVDEDGEPTIAAQWRAQQILEAIGEPSELAADLGGLGAEAGKSTRPFAAGGRKCQTGDNAGKPGPCPGESGSGGQGDSTTATPAPAQPDAIARLTPAGREDYEADLAQAEQEHAAETEEYDKDHAAWDQEVAALSESRAAWQERDSARDDRLAGLEGLTGTSPMDEHDAALHAADPVFSDEFPVTMNSEQRGRFVEQAKQYVDELAETFGTAVGDELAGKLVAAGVPAEEADRLPELGEEGKESLAEKGRLWVEAEESLHAAHDAWEEHQVRGEPQRPEGDEDTAEYEAAFRDWIKQDDALADRVSALTDEAETAYAALGDTRDSLAERADALLGEIQGRAEAAVDEERDDDPEPPDEPDEPEPPGEPNWPDPADYEQVDEEESESPRGKSARLNVRAWMRRKCQIGENAGKPGPCPGDQGGGQGNPAASSGETPAGPAETVAPRDVRQEAAQAHEAVVAGLSPAGREEYEADVKQVEREHADATEAYERDHAAWEEQVAAIDSKHEEAHAAWEKEVDDLDRKAEATHAAWQERDEARDNRLANLESLTDSPMQAHQDAIAAADPTRSEKFSVAMNAEERAAFRDQAAVYVKLQAEAFGQAFGPDFAEKLQPLGMPEKDAARVAQLGEKGQADLGKKGERWLGALEKHHAAEDALEAHAAKEPQEPEADDPGYDAWETAHEAWDQKNDALEAKVSAMSDAADAAYEAIDGALQTLTDKADDLMTAGREKAEAAVEKERDADEEPPSVPDEYPDEPEEPDDYPDEPEAPEEPDWPDPADYEQADEDEGEEEEAVNPPEAHHAR